MKISKRQLKEIIKEEIKSILKEEDYDTLRDKYGRISRKKTSKRRSLPARNMVYLDVSDREAKNLLQSFYGRIFKDDKKNAWYFTMSDSLRVIPKEVKDNMDTKLTDKEAVKKVKKMKTD